MTFSFFIETFPVTKRLYTCNVFFLWSRALPRSGFSLFMPSFHNKNAPAIADAFGSGSGRNRTADTRIFSPLLYQLSYRAMYSFKMAVRTGLEPATSCVTGRHSNQLNYRTSVTCPKKQSWCSFKQVRKKLA